MTLVILDPNLAHAHGHHMEWDLAIADAAHDRGQDAIIFANRHCQIPSKQGLEIVPLFSHATYESKYDDKIAGKFDNFTYYNDALAAELSLIPRERLRATDALLVPTLTENHLLGYVSWMRTFDSSRAPLFVLWLMFQSGVDYHADDGARGVLDPFQALFYRLAFRRAAEPGAPIHFFGGGRQIAREFSALTGSTIEAHALPCAPKRSRIRGEGDKPAALLFAGDAKLDKGFIHIPELADRLCTNWPDWDFVIHANSGSSWGPALEAYARLVNDVAPRHENLILALGRLSRDEYLELMNRADCVVSTYDPIIYARKSSGIIWEAISLGLPMLLPSGTWLEREAADWGAGCATYDEYSVDCIVDSFYDFSIAVPSLAYQSAQASEQYRALNGGQALMDQIGRLWAPRMLAASLVIQPPSWFIPIEEIELKGWSFPETFEGRVVRWVGKTFEISFQWAFNVQWQVALEVVRFFDEAQLTQARAFADGRDLHITTIPSGSGGPRTLRITGEGTRQRAAVTLRIELPWAASPPGEARQLGLLMRSVHISPSEPAGQADSTNRLEITTRVKRTESNGFLLQKAVSGRALINPHNDQWIHFLVTTNGGPQVARAIAVYVNGIPLRVESIAVGGDRWAMKARCSPEVLAASGYWADWDIVSLADLQSEIQVDRLLISESPEAEPPPDLLSASDNLGAAPNKRTADTTPLITSSPPASVLVTAKAFDPDSGGFHSLEYGDRGSAFRWTGPSTESHITVQIDRTRPVMLTFRILSLGNNQPDELSADVDGALHPLHELNRSQSTFAAGPVCARAGNGSTVVTIKVKQLIRPSSDGASDKRTLGVALEWMRAEAVLDA